MSGFLNPDLDPAPARSRLAAEGRAQIADVLAPETAEALHAAMAEVPWRRMWDTPSRLDVPVPVFESQPVEDQTAVIAGVHAEAREGFQFLFDRHRVGVASEAGIDQPAPLDAAYRALNSEAFLAFARDLTGDGRIAYLDCQATRYLPGHFLNGHDDEQEASGRLYAYVLNLTPDWRAEWGGWLTFLGEDGAVEQIFTPAFNALNLFRVPQVHAVTPVAAFAGAPRYSLTGWMRTHGP